MTVHIQTGNRLDVVIGHDPDLGKEVVLGLMRHHSDELIPLPDPKALAAVLLQAIDKTNG